jgi:hypothetical protein
LDYCPIPLHLAIFLSTMSRRVPYRSREIRMMFPTLFPASLPPNGSKLTAENGSPASPSIINFTYISYLARLRRSRSEKTGAKTFRSRSVSRGPTRKETKVPTFPNTASCTSSSSCDMYWWARMRLSRYLRASERIVAKDSIAKFWNSSTY